MPNKGLLLSLQLHFIESKSVLTSLRKPLIKLESQTKIIYYLMTKFDTNRLQIHLINRTTRIVSLCICNLYYFLYHVNKHVTSACSHLTPSLPWFVVFSLVFVVRRSTAMRQYIHCMIHMHNCNVTYKHTSVLSCETPCIWRFVCNVWYHVFYFGYRTFQIKVIAFSNKVVFDNLKLALSWNWHTGGVWLIGDSFAKDSWRRETLVSNTSREMTCFSDFPFPKEAPPFLTSDGLIKYYQVIIDLAIAVHHQRFVIKSDMEDNVLRNWLNVTINFI